MMTEESLIGLLKAGDESAYRLIFKYHYVPLCVLAQNYVRDRFTAQTIVDDAIFSLWEKRDSLNIDISVRAYLAKSVRNRCLDHLKSKHARLEISYSALDDNQLKLCSAHIDESHALGALLEKELEHKIMEAIERIPEASRTVFTLSRRHGLTNQEIASKLGISVNTVKYHMKRSLAILHSAMRDYLISTVLLISLLK